MEWIRTKDSLPEYGRPVLLVYCGIVQYVVYFRDIGEFRPDNDGDPMPEGLATHWMYLPEPPEPK